MKMVKKQCNLQKVEVGVQDNMDYGDFPENVKQIFIGFDDLNWKLT
jgi:hypothetical protein